MKTIVQHSIKKFAVLAIALFTFSCGTGSDQKSTNSTEPSGESMVSGGQAMVQDDESQPNVVKVAVGSKDHSTLVKAVQTADLVNALSNNGPFTVFAPTNMAFDALPAGTVEGLLKPEKRDALTDILQYHVYVGVLTKDLFKDGQSLGMVNGSNAIIHVKDGKYYINDAEISASVMASNGVVHVIDKVLLPPATN